MLRRFSAFSGLSDVEELDKRENTEMWIYKNDYDNFAAMMTQDSSRQHMF